MTERLDDQAQRLSDAQQRLVREHLESSRAPEPQQATFMERLRTRLPASLRSEATASDGVLHDDTHGSQGPTPPANGDLTRG